MEWERALKWVINHQNPPENEVITIVEMSHPISDGDGFATRVKRFVTKIIPVILKGDVVVLRGGFRGYTDSRGFESIFQPFFSYGTGRWERFPPNDLPADRNFWFSVVAWYFIRPSEEVKRYIDTVRENLPEKYMGVHLRYGDNHYGRKVPIEEYVSFVKQYDLPVYVASDSSEAMAKFGDSVKFHSQGQTKSIDMSRPGQSAANHLIRNEKEPWIIDVAKEILCDMILLSESENLIGIRVSQVVLVAGQIGMYRKTLKDFKLL